MDLQYEISSGAHFYMHDDWLDHLACCASIGPIFSSLLHPASSLHPRCPHLYVSILFMLNASMLLSHGALVNICIQKDILTFPLPLPHTLPSCRINKIFILLHPASSSAPNSFSSTPILNPAPLASILSASCTRYVAVAIVQSFN